MHFWVLQWWLLAVVSASISILFYALSYFFYESPKYLVSTGHENRAAQTSVNFYNDWSQSCTLLHLHMYLRYLYSISVFLILKPFPDFNFKFFSIFFKGQTRKKCWTIFDWRPVKPKALAVFLIFSPNTADSERLSG